MDMQVTDNPMKNILCLLRQNRKIEAIKVLRDTYDVISLKMAKDIVEAISRCMPDRTEQNEYIVISRQDLGDDYQVSQADNKELAMQEANRIVDDRVEVVVAAVVARSIVTRAMAEVT
jgi:hypothetical protein